MAGSILSDTKKALGIASDYVVFDPEITMFINSALATLNQLGIGPANGYVIANANDTWDEFIADNMKLEPVKSYVYLRVKMLFDPPQLGFLLDEYRKQLDELTWRIMVVEDEILNPLPDPLPDPQDIVIP
jgi:hypothetical protein